jgi:hypothetical protein
MGQAQSLSRDSAGILVLDQEKGAAAGGEKSRMNPRNLTWFDFWVH